MSLNLSRNSNLITNFGTSRTSQNDLGKISLYANDTTTSRNGTNVNQKQFTLGQFSNLGLLLIISLDTQQTTQ
ncbi:hypothetical protein G6F42_018485 [Rhizopus arrhizus]|nr:hypothetical protein G6F42_018485 [Rhizopus arrhizus]